MIKNTEVSKMESSKQFILKELFFLILWIFMVIKMVKNIYYQLIDGIIH